MRSNVIKVVLLPIISISLSSELLKKLDEFMQKKGYSSRSEAIRDLIRKTLIIKKQVDPESKSFGTFTMIYDHHIGMLTNKLMRIQHDHTSEILTTTHIHIDHNNCLEILVLKGKTKNIQQLADNIKSLKGIKHGELVITTTNF